MGSWRKALKASTELVFVDAPFRLDEAAAQRTWCARAGAARVPPSPPSTVRTVDLRPGCRARPATGGACTCNGHRTACRWRWKDAGSDIRPATAAHYTGWDEAQAAIASAMLAHAPVHGIMGFSQGATCAALYCAASRAGVGGSRLPCPDFVIVCSGFLPRDARWAKNLTERELACASFHAYGSADALVPPERSAALADHFAPGSRTVHVHEKGHLIPTCTGPFRDDLHEFLARAALLHGCDGS